MVHPSREFVTVHDRTGRLVAMAAEFSSYFGFDPDDPDVASPPFPWWPEEGHEVLELGFQLGISERGSVLEGVEFLANFKTASGEVAPFLVGLRKLSDGTTAFYAKPQNPDGYAELAQRAMDLGRFARLLDSERPTSGMREGLRLLSDRERTVVQMLLRGHRIDAVAQELHISVHTARNHRKSIFGKLGVRSHVELIAKLGTPEDLGLSE